MAWETIVAGVVVLSLAVFWYGLQAVALRDLRARPRVRGGNKILWAFAILCVPYLGALGYLSVGPTSFLPRTGRVRPAGLATTRDPVDVPAQNPPSDVLAFARVHRVPASPPVTFRDSPSPFAPPVRAVGPSIAGLTVDPVIGTDSTDLIVTRPSSVRRTRPAPMPDAIRWPGSGVPAGWHQADAGLHD